MLENKEQFFFVNNTVASFRSIAKDILLWVMYVSRTCAPHIYKFIYSRCHFPCYSVRDLKFYRPWRNHSGPKISF